MRRLNSSQGLTLVELAVAIMVLAMGIVATMRSFDATMGAASGLDARLLSQIALQNRSAELKLFGPGATLPSEVSIANKTVRIDSQQTATAGGLIQTTLTARGQDGAGAQIVIYLDPLARQ